MKQVNFNEGSKREYNQREILTEQDITDLVKHLKIKNYYVTSNKAEIHGQKNKKVSIDIYLTNNNCITYIEEDLYNNRKFTYYKLEVR